jgi:hypothetical protein
LFPKGCFFLMFSPGRKPDSLSSVESNWVFVCVCCQVQVGWGVTVHAGFHKLILEGAWAGGWCRGSSSHRLQPANTSFSGISICPSSISFVPPPSLSLSWAQNLWPQRCKQNYSE